MSEGSATTEIIRERAVDREHAKGLDDVLKQVGLETASVLDTLNESGRELFVNEWVDKTGFPDFTLVSEGIKKHAMEALMEAAGQSKIEVLYSGYDKSCSVGRGVALPGSDLDGWSILIKGNESDKQRLFETIIGNLDPSIFDLWSLDISKIITLDELKSFANNGRKEMGMDNRSDVARAGMLLETLREGGSLLNNLGQEENWIRASKLYKESGFLHKDVPGKTAAKLKHKTRNALIGFDKLSTDEKFIIVRIIQQTNEGISINLNVRDDNPNSRILASLVNKGVLWYANRTQDRVFAPWIHKSQNAEAIPDFGKFFSIN